MVDDKASVKAYIKNQKKIIATDDAEGINPNKKVDVQYGSAKDIPPTHLLLRLWGSTILNSSNFNKYDYPTFIILANKKFETYNYNYFYDSLDPNYPDTNYPNTSQKALKEYAIILLNNQERQKIASFERHPHYSTPFPDFLKYSWTLKKDDKTINSMNNIIATSADSIEMFFRDLESGIQLGQGEYLLEIKLELSRNTQLYVEDFNGSREVRNVGKKTTNEFVFRRRVYIPTIVKRTGRGVTAQNNYLSENVCQQKINELELLDQNIASLLTRYSDSQYSVPSEAFKKRMGYLKEYWQMYKNILYDEETIANYGKCNLFFKDKVLTYKEFNEKLKNVVTEFGSGIIKKDKEIHYARNAFNRYFNSLDDLIDYNTNNRESQWKLLDIGQSVYHMFNEGGEYNVKFVSFDEMFEAVYNSRNGCIITDCVNMGTFNFFGPENKFNHTNYDVIPYWDYGNTKDHKVSFGLVTLNTKALIQNNNKYNGNYKAQAHYYYVMMKANPSEFEKNVRTRKHDCTI